MSIDDKNERRSNSNDNDGNNCFCAFLRKNTVKTKWCDCMDYIRCKIIMNFVIAVSQLAARNPKRCMASVICFSFSVLGIGFLTNFYMNVETLEIYGPFKSPPKRHMDWINTESGFPKRQRPISLILHTNGQNIVTIPTVNKVFDAIETIMSLPNYDLLCNDNTRSTDCDIYSITQFWNHNRTKFEQRINTDDDLGHAFAQSNFPSGVPVDLGMILGNANTSTSTDTANAAGRKDTRVTFAQSYIFYILLPDIPSKTKQFEKEAIRSIFQLQQQWDQQNDILQQGHSNLEIFAERSWEDEFTRAIIKDFPLIPLCFIIMSVFTCIYFFKYNNRLQSRALLGLASVFTIMLSIMTGYGIMFIIGVPFTSMTNIIPFIIFGVGLDDTFIIMGEYFRINNNSTVAPQYHNDNHLPVYNMKKTMQNVSVSIVMTTATTSLAFILGTMSTVPAIYWLCIYAFTTIIIDFLYQITFFVAAVMLDEKRIQNNKKDVCFCYTAAEQQQLRQNDDDKDQNDEFILVQQQQQLQENNTNENDNNISQNKTDATGKINAKNYTKSLQTHQQQQQQTNGTLKLKQQQKQVEEENVHIVDRFMKWYAKILLKPISKGIVIVSFIVYTIACGYSTTLLTQEFDFTSLVPKDSYVSNFFTAIEQYSNRLFIVEIYFRYVNQSNPIVQQQMLNYIQDLTSLDMFGNETQLCLISDYHKYYKNMFPENNRNNITYSEQIEYLLNTFEFFNKAYSKDIVFDENNNIIASRCYLYITSLDLNEVNLQIDALNQQREITQSQPINNFDNNNNFNYNNHGKNINTDNNYVYLELDEDSSSSSFFTSSNPNNNLNGPFFTFEKVFFIWQFYSVAIKELISTTITSVIAVSIVGFVFIPHWTATIFVLPAIAILYIDLLGTIQFAGVHINAVSYIALVISIGLLVDFIMHLLLRYYESTYTTREGKVKDALETMGASILVGGISTFLGVTPMSFTSSEIFKTFCISFFAMVVLGIAHGLILLPVVLSIFGPVNSHSNIPLHQEHNDNNKHSNSDHGEKEAEQN